MRIGIRSWNISRTFDEALAFCSELDVEGIQIHPEEANLYEATDDELKAFKEKVERSGLVIASSVSGPNLVDPAKTECALQQFEKLFHAAALLGYRLVTGEVKFLGPGQSVEDGWKRCVGNMKHVCDLADSKGAVFCLEPWPPNLVHTTDDLLRLLEEVDNPRLRINFDGGNLWGAGCDSVTAARQLAPYVAHVHVKDWDRTLGPQIPMWRPTPDDPPYGFRPVRGETLLGDGEVNWTAIFRELEQAGYDGWLVIERNRSSSPEEDARTALQRLKEMLAQ